MGLVFKMGGHDRHDTWSYCGQCERLSRERDPVKRRRGSLVDSLMEVEGMEPNSDKCCPAHDLYCWSDREELYYPDELG
jgi:hypothetical protein